MKKTNKVPEKFHKQTHKMMRYLEAEKHKGFVYFWDNKKDFSWFGRSTDAKKLDALILIQHLIRTFKIKPSDLGIEEAIVR